jgi:hypothetical protein
LAPDRVASDSFPFAGLDEVVRLGAIVADGLRVGGRVEGDSDEVSLLSGPPGIAKGRELFPSSHGSLLTVVRGLILMMSVLDVAFLRTFGALGPASAPVDIADCWY